MKFPTEPNLSEPTQPDPNPPGPDHLPVPSSPAAQSIASRDDIRRIRKSLENKPRDLLLFDMALQTGVPAEQWLRLRAGQLIDLGPGETLLLTAQGRPTKHRIVMNEVLHRSFSKYIEARKPTPDQYIFKSRKGEGPLTLSSVSRLVKGWMKDNGVETSGSLLSLRKTWALHASGSPAPPSVQDPNTPKKDFLRPIRVPTRQEMVYKELETAILSGHIRPGERIISDEVAQRLGVSQIPVREALRRLEAVGLISSRPNYGSTVTELSKENLEEILEIRIHLECLAAEKAARRRSGDLLDQLAALHQRYATARASNNTDDLLQSNKKFHHTLYRAAGMPILANMIEQLWDRVSPYYYILFRQSVKPNPVIGIKHHLEIINAIRCGDPEGVSTWLKADLTDSTRFVLSLFEEPLPSP